MPSSVSELRKGTSTSAFGVSKREAHDATDFYARFTAPELNDDDTLAPAPARQVDQIFVGHSREMNDVPTASVALVVTSPPYFAGKEYEERLGEGAVPGTYIEYLRMLEEVFAECVRTMEPGGRIAVNVANLGRKPYRSLSSDVITILQDRLRLLLRGEVIWQKARGSTGSCAWGSFQSPTNPVLRDLTERVVIASKGRFDRALSARQRHAMGFPATNSLGIDDFMEATTDVWEIPSESATRVKHPAPFPVDLPRKLIDLYTYQGDLVLDPFMGSGTTAVAALRTGRHFVGYDTEAAYVQLARQRVEQERARLALPDGLDRGDFRFERPAIPQPAPPGENFQSRAVREGQAAKRIAHALLKDCGFASIKADVKLPHGVEANFRALDRIGQPWLFDVSGAFTSSRPGLMRTDTLWKALGKAAVVHATQPQLPLVLLTTCVPPIGSSGHRALSAVLGRGKAITDIIEMLSESDVKRLHGYAERGLEAG
ncbi:MAG: DNA-methyltransferase [Actinomycetota bacterium]